MLHTSPARALSARRSACAAALLLAAGLTSPALAQPWDGGGSTNNWSDPLNWSGFPVPQSSNSTLIFFNASSRLNSNLDLGPGPFQLFDLTFNASAGNYNLTGSEIQFVGGRLFFHANSTVTINNNLSVASGFGALNIQGTGAGTLILNGNLASTGAFAKAGAYTLLLAGNNTISGTVSIGDSTTSGGVLGAATNAALGTSTSLTVGNGSTFRAYGTFTQTRGMTMQGAAGGTVEVTAGNTLTHNGTVSGTVFTKTGAGTLILGNTGSWTGNTNINQGILQAGLASQLGSAAGTHNLNGGTLRLTAAFNLSRSLAVGASGGTLDLQHLGTTNLTSLTGTGTLTKTGTGTLNLTSLAGNPLSGGINITGGAVQTNTTLSGNSLGSGPVSISNDAILRLHDGWNANNFITLAAGGGRIDVPAGVATATGEISGTTLTKTGAGRLHMYSSAQPLQTLELAAGEVYFGSLANIVQINTAPGTNLGGAPVGVPIGTSGNLRLGGSLGTPARDNAFFASTLEALATSVLNFEFEQPGSPFYTGNDQFSGNDFLRLTGAQPFVAPLAAGAVINIFLNAGALEGSEVFRGGIFTDVATDFAAALANATINVYLADPQGSTAYGGQNYSPLALPFTLATVPDAAGFGLVNGRVMQLTLVPTPATAALFALAGTVAARRRRSAI